jgi:hypothetical protein
LPPVYARDRGTALSKLAAAHAANDDPAQAAITAQEALAVVRSSGSGRMLNELVLVGESLSNQTELPEVAQLLELLAEPVGA